MKKTARFLSILSIAAAITLSTTGSAFAQFESTISKALDIFQNLRTLIYILGGFGIAAVAVAAIFGKISWKWLATICFGLFIISMAEQIARFITDEDLAKYPVASGTGTGTGTGGGAQTSNDVPKQDDPNSSTTNKAGGDATKTGENGQKVDNSSTTNKAGGDTGSLINPGGMSITNPEGNGTQQGEFSFGVQDPSGGSSTDPKIPDIFK